MDGPNKETSDINTNSICLIKKKGKVKALDEELYSGFISNDRYLYVASNVCCSVFQC